MRKHKYSTVFFKTLESICVMLLVVIVVSICYQIICRFLNIGQGFTEELARISFILLVFIGAPLVAAEGLHISVDILFNALPEKWQRIISIFDGLLEIILSLFCVIGVRMLISTNKGITAASLNWFRMNWIYNVMQIAFFVQLIVSCVQIFQSFTGKNTTISLLGTSHEQEPLEVEIKL